MSLSSSTLRAIAALEPYEQRRVLREQFAKLPAHAQEEASRIVAALPRLIYHLAMAGALAAPSLAALNEDALSALGAVA